jgi:hypothetical protein
MVELSDADRASVRSLFIAWAIASVPGLVWTIVELDRFYGPDKLQGWWFAADGIIQGVFTEAITFGTIGWGILRLASFRYDGHLPLGWFHPLLETYRPASMPGSETTLDRLLLGRQRRSAWRVPVAVTLSVVVTGFLFWLGNPDAFTSFASRDPMGARAPADAVVNAAVVVLATGFAYRRGGLLGCWGIVYGPIVVLTLYHDPGSTTLAVLGGVLESVSYTAWMAVDAYLIGVALRWLVADPPRAIERRVPSRDADPS